MSELSNLKSSVSLFENTLKKAREAREFLNLDISEEEANLVSEDINSIKDTIKKLRLEILLNGEFDKCNAYIEIHSGAGGTESNDWANMLLRMYLRYFEKKGYKHTIVSQANGEEVGIKGAIVDVKGENAFGYLKGETGVHRLVRISPFDSNKRRHTSFASVLVTPQIDTKIEVNIREEDLKIDVYRSSGAGGQSVNTANSAVRITHVPTGVVVTCQTERSQLRNKERAMQLLKIKINDELMHKQESAIGAERKSKIGTGDRSEKIRTYNYPQNRVTDHRINFSTMTLDRVMDGELEPVIEALITEDLKLKLAGMSLE